MNEDEAKTKHCCAAMGQPQSHFNQDGLCIGSKCMAWRVDEHAFEKWAEWRDDIDSVGKPEGSHIEEKTLGDFGYCGLAGKP